MKAPVPASARSGTFDALRQAGYDIRTLEPTPPAFGHVFKSGELPPEPWRLPYTVGSTPSEILVVDGAWVYPSGEILVDDYFLRSDTLFVNYRPKRYQIPLLTSLAVWDEAQGRRVPPPEFSLSKIDRPVFVATNFRASNAYHFMHEILGRLHFLELAEAEFGRLPILVNRPKFPIQYSLLAEIFGDREILWHPREAVVEASQAIISRHPAGPLDLSIPSMRRLRARLRELAGNPVAEGPPIYISRGDARSRSFGRNLIDERPLIALFSRYGFRTMIVGQESPEAQIHSFSRAPAIAGIHGAGLTNMMFMPDGGAVIEISGVPLTNDHMARDAELFGFDYKIAVSSGDDVRVDPDLVAIEANLDYLCNQGVLPALWRGARAAG